MISKKEVLSTLPDLFKTIDIAGLGKKYQGKVRDFYILKDKRIIVTTDRLSAFDVVLGYIPFKGSVLNMLADFWFEKTKKIINNHVIEVPDQNVTVAKNCQNVPVEMIVRGYMSGVTKTSIWHSYRQGERTIYGITFPDGMKKNQKLAKPIITPTTHPAAGSKLHDERLTREEIIKNNIVDGKLYKKMEDAALKLFDFGSKWCEKRGLILVDTKYEFGVSEEELVLIDEIHTPDSSRFWKADSYAERFKNEEEPENYDKEFLRLWYAEKGYRGDGEPPEMSEDLIVDVTRRYIDVYEKITGEKFEIYEYPIEERIEKNVKKFLNKK